MPKPTPSDVAEYYSKKQIETASKGKAVYMLHERSMYLLSKAQSIHLRKSFYYIKVQNILSQLQRSLRITDSVSQSLFYLYDYCYLCLERGGDRAITNVLEILGILKDTFQKLLRKP